MFESDTDQDAAEVQMAPLIDCVFLLLIFFLVASQLKETEKELQLELPEAAAAVTVVDAEPPLLISVDREGALYFGSQPITLDQLHRHVKSVAEQTPQRRVRIDGDKYTPFQHIVHVMDLCQFEGLRNVGVHIADDEQFSP